MSYIFLSQVDSRLKKQRHESIGELFGKRKGAGGER
jgi:hypothetical protein